MAILWDLCEKHLDGEAKGVIWTRRMYLLAHVYLIESQWGACELPNRGTPGRFVPVVQDAIPRALKLNNIELVAELCS